MDFLFPFITLAADAIPVWQPIVAAVVIILMLAVLATGRFGTDLVMLGVLTVFLLTGIITPTQAFSGFSNAGLMTVAFLYIVATGLQETGGMHLITDKLIGRPKSATQARARMTIPVVGLSACMNNTPLVAMFIPVVRDFAKRARIAPSQLFMPLSFAAILGGACTLIGTSTNLVVYSLIEGYNKEHPDAPIASMGFWTISAVGVPVAIIGLTYMLLLSGRLLPKAAVSASEAEAQRHYTTAMLVSAGSPVAGKTIEEAGLRHLPGLYLSRIDRADESEVAVGPDEPLREQDVLVFVGALDSVVDLQKIKGLSPVLSGETPSHYRPQMRLIEAVVSRSSPLVGRSIRESGIRTRYGAVVVAVNRLGHRLEGKIGDIVLRIGDTLLLEADKEFVARFKDSHDFYLLSAVEGAATPRHDRAWIALGILAAVIALMSIGKLPFIGEIPEVLAALCGACAMILLRCCTGPQARAGIEWPVIIVIGCSFGLGKAMENTGLALYIANHLTSWAGPYGPWAIIATVYLLTLGFTTLISNNAAAALMFPIALSIATAGDYNFLPFAIAICLAASLEFMTPLGYQTNLMVMAPGGYKWSDFMRFGGPLTLLVAIVSIVLIPIIYGL